MGIVTVFDRETGRILRTVHACRDVYLPAGTEAVLDGAHDDNCRLVIGMDDVGDELLSVATVEPAAPSIESLRSAAWSKIKAARLGAETAPLAVGDRLYDADADSQRRIAGAVQLAVLAPAGWTIDWTLADNTVATLTAAEVVAVGIALGAQVSAAHAVARLLREQIDAAASIYDLNAITWPSP